MEEWKKRHPHAFIQIMTQELLRSIDENDLDQAKDIANQIQALNTVADEIHKKTEYNYEGLANLVSEFRSGYLDLVKKDFETEELEDRMETLNVKLEREEEVSEYDSESEFMKELLREKEIALEKANTQLEDTKKKLENSIEASKLQNVRICSLEEINKKLSFKNITLKNQLMSFKLLEAKYQKLENESKENKTKMAISAKETEILYEKLESEKQKNRDLRSKLKSLDAEYKALNLKHQIEDCVACGVEREEIFAFLPCLHAKTCKNCCEKILQSIEDFEVAKCPYCRVDVTEFKKIFA